MSGEIAARSIDLATELALSGKIDAVVTAPISKFAIQLAGFNFTGHTEFLASLAGGKTPVMLMVAGKTRIAVATTHVHPRKDTPQRHSGQVVATGDCVKTPS